MTGVELTPTTASVAVGAKTQLTSVVKPENATNKNVTFKSSDDTKATVSATGEVTGVAEGTATITVTTEDEAKTATSTITVTA
ncbi:structural protein with Ig domain [Enterococcus phage vB_EfaP_Ef7.2]|uniref:Tail tube protein n=1 Tax=Enterococcus phage vB_EfaP_Ef7.2 TaxID=2546618 RepID=A0A4D6DSE4_9CAUD|nr:structural protein with Ig domain [Enterococcus phage vB_EfaP_Ef7.2]QBZ69048.1 tail tube protein [Enterococcus phage vB_EfaP_Ef7.2]